MFGSEGQLSCEEEKAPSRNGWPRLGDLQLTRIDPASGNVQDYATGELQPGGVYISPRTFAFGLDGKTWISFWGYEPEVMDPATRVVQGWTTTYPPLIISPSLAPLGTTGAVQRAVEPFGCAKRPESAIRRCPDWKVVEDVGHVWEILEGRK